MSLRTICWRRLISPGLTETNLLAGPRWPQRRAAGRPSVKVRRAAVFAALAFASPASATPLSIADFGQLALRCGPWVAPSTLASIARTESSFEPLAINDNTTRTSGVPASADIAIQVASKLIEARHSVDVGIMQINSGNLQTLGLKLDAAFDPCKSIAGAATILAGDFAGGGDSHEAQQAALRVAISKYNTGDGQRGFDNGYVHKVELAARRIVPALDVGTGPAAIDSAPLPAAAPAPAPDPNAPPSWDVWASFDYDAAHRKDPSATAHAGAVPARLAVSDAGKGPAATVIVAGPGYER
jgi:type IV secretion system protein VirB1